MIDEAEILAPLAEPAFEILATGHQFCEAVREGADGAVYYSDLTGGGLFGWRANSGTETVVPGRKWIGGCVLNADGRLIVSGADLVIVDPRTGVITPLLSEIAGVRVAAINDIEADASGNLYGGTVDFAAILDRGEPPAPGLFFRMAPDGAVEVIREGVSVSNGIGFSPAGDTLYHSECNAGVWAYAYADGRPRDPRMFAAMDDCDGLAVDAEGGVWVARWREGELLRYRPDAVIDRRIRLPMPHIISLGFGGPDRADLFVATGGTARNGDPVGGLVRIRSDIPGLPSHTARFA
ncbi:SMP-30/gluconolactonase/LRE family protein [Sphingomonas profundi]|uniref:SMP-30/gluconolactonase/LRE family protein n=1 Tax=Alterirhizorhabdus profundi TaxID=2681549 RepID=UPI0012E9895D|nr:SMP-30/gluconolactonase/LRE family protein [Sphingomonas profundi]